MSKIIKYKNQNIIKQRLYLLGIISTLLMFIASIYIVGTTMQAVYFLITVLCIIVGKYLQKQYGIISSGVTGERNTLKIMKSLPKEYTVFSNPKFNFRGRVTELDYLIISDSNIVIVEVKNHGGKIIGNHNVDTWTQVKTSKKGNHYENKFKNPWIQVTRHQKIIQSILNKHNVQCTIEKVVYFSNASNINVDLKNITNNRNQLENSILNKGKRLPQKQIISIMKKYISK